MVLRVTRLFDFGDLALLRKFSLWPLHMNDVVGGLSRPFELSTPAGVLRSARKLPRDLDNDIHIFHDFSNFSTAGV